MYTCPEHGLPLLDHGDHAICKQCSDTFPIENGIWLLDRVQRPDRLAFDAHVVTSPPDYDLGRAAAHLAAAEVKQIRRATILDVGCGLGDITAGLVQSPGVADSDVYAFDHSIQSLRRAAESIRPQNGNRVFFSAQDASRLCFAPGSFNIALGSAVLHHLVDPAAFLAQLRPLISTGGVAVFSEPFFNGYFWPTAILKRTIEELRVEINQPDLGLSGFILELVSFMARHEGDCADVEALESHTDKHFFQDAYILSAAAKAGFRSVRLSNVAAPDFYRNWMTHFLDTYLVRHELVRETAIEHYNSVVSLAGPALSDLMSHFKYIALSVN